MRNSKPEPDIGDREKNRLLEDMCLALRDVGVHGYGLPDAARAVAAIADVVALFGQLRRRGVDPTDRLEQLTNETEWLMPMLLDDCLRWPDRVPDMRERDGIRRWFRCPLSTRKRSPIAKAWGLGLPA